MSLLRLRIARDVEGAGDRRHRRDKGVGAALPGIVIGDRVGFDHAMITMGGDVNRALELLVLLGVGDRRGIAVLVAGAIGVAAGEDRIGDVEAGGLVRDCRESQDGGSKACQHRTHNRRQPEGNRWEQSHGHFLSCTSC